MGARSWLRNKTRAFTVNWKAKHSYWAEFRVFPWTPIWHQTHTKFSCRNENVHIFTFWEVKKLGPSTSLATLLQNLVDNLFPRKYSSFWEVWGGGSRSYQETIFFMLPFFLVSLRKYGRKKQLSYTYAALSPNNQYIFL